MDVLCILCFVIIFFWNKIPNSTVNHTCFVVCKLTLITPEPIQGDLSKASFVLVGQTNNIYMRALLHVITQQMHGIMSYFYGIVIVVLEGSKLLKRMVMC